MGIITVVLILIMVLLIMNYLFINKKHQRFIAIANSIVLVFVAILFNSYFRSDLLINKLLESKTIFGNIINSFPLSGSKIINHAEYKMSYGLIMQLVSMMLFLFAFVYFVIKLLRKNITERVLAFFIPAGMILKSVFSVMKDFLKRISIFEKRNFCMLEKDIMQLLKITKESNAGVFENSCIDYKIILSSINNNKFNKNILFDLKTKSLFLQEIYLNEISYEKFG